MIGLINYIIILNGLVESHLIYFLHVIELCLSCLGPLISKFGSETGSPNKGYQIYYLAWLQLCCYNIVLFNKCMYKLYI